MRIRVARRADLDAIVEIYNQAVASQSTADLDPVTVRGREEWFGQHPAERHPILVAEAEGEILGWASVSGYRRERRALRHTAEITYYVDAGHRRRKIGSELVREAVRRCPSLGIKTLFAILLEDNHASVGLLESLGFERWGALPRVADFDGREVGHLYYGLRVG